MTVQPQWSPVEDETADLPSLRDYSETLPTTPPASKVGESA